jgi:hypothetical protein
MASYQLHDMHSYNIGSAFKGQAFFFDSLTYEDGTDRPSKNTSN